MDKGTDKFELAIEEHLKMRAFQDPMFAKHLKKPNKNIEDCVTYILNAVKKDGSNGFEDSEIFNLAFHYYVEDNVKVGNKIPSGTVVVNHRVRLTAAEKKEAKDKAYQQVIDEEKKRLRKKPKKTPPSVSKDEGEQTLF